LKIILTILFLTMTTELHVDWLSLKSNVQIENNFYETPSNNGSEENTEGVLPHHTQLPHPTYQIFFSAITGSIAPSPFIKFPSPPPDRLLSI
jgi:hypothetical protein